MKDTELETEVFEGLVIGCLLLDALLINPMREIITKDDFSNLLYGKFYMVIGNLVDQDHPVDIFIVSGILQEDMPSVNVTYELGSLAKEVASTKNALFYAEQIKLKNKRAQLCRSLHNLALDAATSRSLSELIEEGQNQLQIISTAIQPEKPKACMSNILSLVVDEISDALDGKHVLKLATGFRGLDSLLQGIRAGQLLILAARPSMGKTTLALNFMRNIMLVQDKRVLLYSFEMGEAEIARSLIAMTGSIPLSLLKDDQLNKSDIHMGRFGWAVGELNRGKLELISDSSTIGKLKTSARDAKKANPDLSLIIIDYLQLMSKPKSENRVLEISAITRELKLLARELEIPIIALSQLNRNSEGRADKTPVLSDLRDSGSIEQDADIVLFIHRNESDARVIVGKNRSGATGEARLAFDGATATFKELSNG